MLKAKEIYFWATLKKKGGGGGVLWEGRNVKMCWKKITESVYVSVYGVDLWKGLHDELKQSTNINQFKLFFKGIFGWYVEVERLYYLSSNTGWIFGL